MSAQVNFVINISAQFFGIATATPPSSADGARDAQYPIVRDFIANADQTVLAACIERVPAAAAAQGSSNSATAADMAYIRFVPQVPVDRDCLLFYKIPQIAARATTDDVARSHNGGGGDVAQLGMLSLEGGLVKSMYSSVARVFAPHNGRRAEYSAEVEHMLTSLHTVLGMSLGFPQSGVHSVQDEIGFWAQLVDESPTKADRNKAKTFVTTLGVLNEHVRELETGSSLRALSEFLDNVHGLLDDLWRLHELYPQNRMRDLIDVISASIVACCTDNLRPIDVFSVSSTHCTDLLAETSEHLHAWLRICDSLTRLFWPNNGQHQWLGEPHVPQHARRFVDRLAAITGMRAMFQQIVVVFSTADADDDTTPGTAAGNNYHYGTGTTTALRLVQAICTQCRDVQLFDTSPFGEKRWSQLQRRLELLLEPVDEQIAALVRRRQRPHATNARQLVHSFAGHAAILRREAVMKLLTVEREQFAAAALELIEETRRRGAKEAVLLVAGAAGATAAGAEAALDLSPVCRECQWLKMYEQQMAEIASALPLLAGHAQFEGIRSALESVQEELAKQLTESFALWRDQSLAAVQSGDLSLKTDAPVVEFERDGRQLMRVTFNPRLVTFCQDVRQLEALGLSVPLELRDTCTLATTFTAAARRLQQIANFHNTIGDRMIACQRPIMLSNARELSALVRGESVTWNDRASVDRYVQTLQVSVGRLDRDNTYLYGQHEAMKTIIVHLMHVDLIRQAALWKEEMRRMRDIVAGLESKGYQNLDAFKLHWDYQLYKVLEHQYVTGLQDLANKLPDIHVDLVFRQQELQFRPPLEELRHTYFEYLRRHLEQPRNAFRGLSAQSAGLFAQMIERNSEHFAQLYERSELAFEELAGIRDVWQPWVALGRANMDDLCAVHLRTWTDWDRNFKSCKHFGQQIAKLQTTEIRSACFVVNVQPLHADIEQIGRRYWETLASTLRTAILADVDALQSFVQSALLCLQNVPSLDESGIAEAGAQYERIINALPAQRDRLAEVERKDTCLAGWCKERVTSLGQLLAQWDQLQPLIENQSVVLQRHVDMMRDHIGTQIAGWRDDAERFEIRWQAAITELRSAAAADSNASGLVLAERKLAWQELQARRQRLVDDCGKFNVDAGPEVAETFDRIDGQVAADTAEWADLEEFSGELEQVLAEEWAVYRRRPYVFGDFQRRWSERVVVAAGNGAAAASGLTMAQARIREQLDGFQAMGPVLQTMQADGLTERHWSRLFALLGAPAKSMHDVLLRDVVQLAPALVKHAQLVQTLVREAAGEQVIRQALGELEQWGATAVLHTTDHRDAKGVPLTLGKDFQETLNKIGDNQSLLQSAKNSSSFETFSDQAAIWEGRLSSLDAVLTSLNLIQRKWIYLEPIFNTGTMQSDGNNTFQRIDKDFRYVMKHIADDTRLLSIIKISNIATIIESLETQLARCQSALMAFITLKRNAFPRFYFLADDDLLEILGQSAKPDIVQKHIGKLFPGVQRLGLAADSSAILHVQSADGDSVRLARPIPIGAAVPVEQWLSELVVGIRDALVDLTERCARLDRFQLADIAAYPAQVLSTAKALSFTRQTERAIQSMALPALRSSLQTEVDLYNSDAFRGGLAGSDNTNAEEEEEEASQRKVRALLIDLVHGMDVVEQLIAQNVTRLTDWPWLQQLRFYIDARTRLVHVRQVYAQFAYAYEFLGTPTRLVHTALTHQCYLTLTQAMQMGLGGNPFGPAGTGKTECVKSLGAMLGRLVLVFNCSENVDTAAMALILTGLARCGAWGCFDEFNRLPAATLADISALLQPLQMAIKAQQSTVQLFTTGAAGDAATTTDIPLNLHCAIFVTLNPAGESYGGRQQLPVSLQSLFRPIVMQQPAPADIAAVLLFTERFRHARRLAAQLVEVFRLCEQMLSGQLHYDWGLRELRTVLLACGKLRTAVVAASDDAGDGDDDGFAAESRLVVRALRSNTMSKLSAADCRTFDMLLGRCFTSSVADEADRNNSRQLTDGSADNHDDVDASLRARLLDAFAVLGLRRNERQVEKCLQLHEQLSKRMGVVVLGPPLCGKSTVLALLKQALSGGRTAGGQTIRTYTVSPKAMTRVQLLGNLDADTRQWQDGVLTNMAVVVNAEPSDVSSWIICDGDVDPEWIEALNSVLDDNKLLTLPSGWRIQFGPNVNFIFETHDLRHASPATISRMGIVALSPDDLTDGTLCAAWLHGHNLEPGNQLAAFCSAYLTETLDWLAGQRPSLMHPLFAPSRCALLQSCLPHLDEALANTAPPGADLHKDAFCMALMRGLGASVQAAHVRTFSGRVLELCDVYTPLQRDRAELCYYDWQQRAVLVYETEEASASSSPLPAPGDDASASSSFVRTAHMRRAADLLRCLLHTERSGAPIIVLCGPAGCGKSVLLRHCVAAQRDPSPTTTAGPASSLSASQLVQLACSANLTTAAVLLALRQHCLIVSAVRGREYRAKQGRLVLYLKNVDRCAVDAWGTCAVGELLVQLVQRGGFYAPDTLEWIAVRDLQICASVSMAEGGVASTRLSPRFMAIVRLIVLGAPTDLDMHAIFREQIERAMRRFEDSSGPKLADLVDRLLEFYKQLVSTFNRTQQAHYVFNPKMLSACIAGLQYYPVQCLAEAFQHELFCTFRNRLSNSVDLQTFDAMYTSTFRNVLPAVQAPALHFFVPASGQQPHLKRTATADEWRANVEKCVQICCAESLSIPVPVTEPMLHTVAHIARALVRPAGRGGNLVLCGGSGSGRQRCLHIAGTALNVKMFAPVPVSRYGVEQFYGDLKAALLAAAMDDAQQPVVFHVDHAWLEYLPAAWRPVEAVLQGGEVADVFGDDVDAVASGLRAAAQAEGYHNSLTAYFWSRIHRNFHLVLTLDTDAQLADLFNNYPSLHQNTELLILQPPFDRDTCDVYTRNLLAATIQSQFSIDNASTPTTLPNLPITDLLIGDWSASPLRHLQLTQSYAHLQHDAAAGLRTKMHTLRAGIERLAAANAVVDRLQRQAHAQGAQLDEKKQLAQQSLDQISATMRSANVQRSSLLELREQTQASGAQLLERKAAIEEELRDVEPVLREATAAVGQIRGEALSEIRSLRAPPDVIRDILEGVLRLMGVRDTSWNSMKAFLAKRGVKEDIRGLDPVRITPENCAAVERLLATKADSFQEKNAKRASAAAAPLAAWVIANVKYARVMQSIRPLEREQAQLQKNLEQSEGEMRSLTSGLDDVDVRVKELSGQLSLYTQEAAVLEIRLGEARAMLDAAQGLVEKLSAEYGNWQRQLAELEGEEANLGVRTFLIALAVTHLSHYTLEIRTELLNQICVRLEVAEFNLTKAIISDQDQVIWESIGLPTDVQAIENAAILTKILQLPFGCAPVPLILDPSGLAYTWLCGYLQSHTIAFDICATAHDRFANTLEMAVRFGKCLIVPDVDELAIRPPLLGLLAANADHPVRYNKPQLAVGQKLVDLHPAFRLVLHTRQTSFGGLLRARITCQPFTTTVAGYTEQLMARTVQLRQPRLEAQRVELLHTEGRLLGERTRLQAELLHELSHAEGDILQNAALLAKLNEVKASSSAIDEALAESQRVRGALMGQYDAYRAYCQAAARFFIDVSGAYGGAFTVVEFGELFVQSVEQLNADDGADDTDDANITTLARLTFGTIARTTPKADHLQLGLLICRAAMPHQIPANEWESFITDFMADDSKEPAAARSDEEANTDDDDLMPAFLRPSQHAKLRTLRRNHSALFAALKLSQTVNNVWQPYATQLHVSDAPSAAMASASEFQKLLITQCLRPDLLLNAGGRLICRLLGFKTMSLATANVQQLAEEMRRDGHTGSAERPATRTQRRAILLYTSGGGGGGGSTDDSDPAQDIRDVAHSSVGAARFVQHACRRADSRLACDIVRSAQQLGHWCCLTDVHQLPADGLAAIAQLLGTEDTPPSSSSGAADDFMLWLVGVAQPSSPLPAVLLHKCRAHLYEPPAGVKLQLMHQLQRAQPTLGRLREARALKLRVLGLLLHAVLLARRRYVPQGWSQSYEFGAADGRAALLLIDWWWSSSSAAASGGPLDWSVLRGLCALLAYGGRLSRAPDRRVLDAHLGQFLCDRALTADGWRPLQMQRLSLPVANNVSEYMAAVAAGLPDVERPEMMGLMAATGAQREVLAAGRLLKRLRGVHIAQGEQQVASFERRLKPILSLWRKLNANAAPLETTATAEEPPSSPWFSFVCTEHRIAEAIVQTIHETLINVHATVKQLQQQSASRSSSSSSSSSTNITNITTSMQQIADNIVPTDWRRIWPTGPRVCLDFLRAVRHRATAAQQRMRNATGAAAPTAARFADAMRLCDCFSLAAFMAALKLTNAAELAVSACDLRLRSTLCRSSAVSGGAAAPVTRPSVQGLRIDGAAFRANRIVLVGGGGGNGDGNSAADGGGDDAVPAFQLFYAASAPDARQPAAGGGVAVELPVYASETREHLVCMLDVDTAAEPEAIAIAGVALVLEPQY